MKVLYFTKYSRNGASSRLRSYQFFPFLEKKGINVTVKPFFNENYLNNLYLGKRKSLLMLLRAYLKRFFLLFTIYKYDRIVIEYELFPYCFSWFEKLLFILKIRYIVDYDDATFHNYDMSKNKLILFFLSKKIDNVMKYSGCVIAGNDYLAERARNAGAKKVVNHPTVIDIDRYSVKKTENNKVVIGWIGSPSTLKYVKNIKLSLLNLIKKYDVELFIVGANEDIGIGSNVKYIEWKEKTEVENILKFDIGIMPLENTSWELGKCSYKLIQYMGCGIPIVASSIGMNKQVVKSGINGYLVENDLEWESCLEKLIVDVSLRKKMGLYGRNLVMEKYSLQKINIDLINVIKD
jgi:glycosyltransferase involved in cell wall biosynthesis